MFPVRSSNISKNAVITAQITAQTAGRLEGHNLNGRDYSFSKTSSFPPYNEQQTHCFVEESFVENMQNLDHISPEDMKINVLEVVGSKNSPFLERRNIHTNMDHHEPEIPRERPPHHPFSFFGRGKPRSPRRAFESPKGSLSLLDGGMR